MSAYIEIHELNEAFVTITSNERYAIAELGEYFSFFAPNYKFMPKYIEGIWNGKICLLNYNTQRLYKGLIPYVQKFCLDRGYDCYNHITDLKNNIDVDYLIKKTKLTKTPHDYQSTAVEHCINEKRALLLSPTSSGKSLIIYLISRYIFENHNKKILITVPTISLVNQLYNDFKEYSNDFDVDNNVHKIMEGATKVSNKRIIISTWQSIYKLPRKYFELFDGIIVDECHGAKAENLKGILEKADSTEYRIGLTGTLDGMECNKLVIEGLTGTTYTVTDTNTLQKRGIVSQLKINAIVLEHDITDKNIVLNLKKKKYHAENEFIINNNKRNNFIVNLAKSKSDKKENSLILSSSVDHCKELYNICKSKNIECYMITGKTSDADTREKIRKYTETKTGLVIIATFGVFSTGVSINNLQNLILATNTKSMIRILQSIGRILRLDGKFNIARLYDIVDKFVYNKEKLKSYSLEHFLERVAIYAKQKFSYKTHNINI